MMGRHRHTVYRCDDDTTSKGWSWDVYRRGRVVEQGFGNRSEARASAHALDWHEALQTCVRVAKRRGSKPRDERDAVHEMTHVLDVGMDLESDWDREAVHESIDEQRIGEQFRLECRARAVERVACHFAGIEYDVDKWVGLAMMEALKNGGLSAGFDEWKSVIDLYCDTDGANVAVSLLHEVIALARRLDRIDAESRDTLEISESGAA